MFEIYDKTLRKDLIVRVSFWSLLLILIGKIIYAMATPDPCSMGKYTIGVNCGGVGVEKLRIGLATVLLLISLLFPKIPRKTTLLFLLWILGEYILWWVRTYTMFSQSENYPQIPTLFFMYRADWFDVCILFFSLVLFIRLLLMENYKQYSLR